MTKLMTKPKEAILSGLLVAMLTVGLATGQAGGDRGGGHDYHGHSRLRHHTQPADPSETPIGLSTPEPTPTDPPS